MAAARPSRLIIPRYGDIKGLPAKCMVISNSERMELGCDRRWFHRYAEGLRSGGESRAISYGSGWALVMEDLHRWWMQYDCRYPLEMVMGDGPEDAHPALSCQWCVKGNAQDQRDCPHCQGTTFSILFRLRQEWLQAAQEGEREEAEAEVLTLFRALQGYCESYSAHPSAEYRVVAVEHMVFAPITDPATGKPYRPRLPLVEEEAGWRLARPGEIPTTWASWPWYQVGTIDVVYQHRITGALWIEDAKSSRDAWGYLRNVTVDPQSTGYLWMLKWMLSDVEHNWHLQEWGGDVVGFRWDVSSSTLQHLPRRLTDKPVSKTEIAAQEKTIDEELALRPFIADQMEPAKGVLKKKELSELLSNLLSSGDIGAERDRRYGEIIRWKPPELSKATNISTPSWLYLEAIQGAEPTPDGQVPDLSDYLDHLSWCRQSVDSKLYARESIVASDRDILEYRWEILGIAKQIAGMIQASMKVSTPEELALTFPKTPLCRKPGGSCPFISMCAGGDPDDARREYTVSEGLLWERPSVDKIAISAGPQTGTTEG